MDVRPKRRFTSYSAVELSDLFKTDPAQFEELAAAAINEACIGSSPEQSLKLRRLQWVIDARLRKQKTPQQRLHEMQRIFYDHLYGSEGLIYKLNSACNGLVEAFSRPRTAAKPQPVLRVVKRGEA